MSEFRLLIIADLHFTTDQAEMDAMSPKRQGALAKELLRRAIEDAKRRGRFDAIALMGDMINNGEGPAADEDLDSLRVEIEAAAPGAPLLVVPGNHDGDADRLPATFGDRAGLHEIGGYRFVTFADPYAEGDVCTRRESDRQLLRDLAGRDGGPIVVLQHNPVDPPIESDYPYMHTNHEAVMADYAEAGATLSISGHYHPGQPMHAVGGVRYFTTPALCEAPFQYATATLRGRDAEVEVRRLAAPCVPPLVDCHAHTEFAYCAEDVSAERNIERARTFGLAGLCLTEHAGQLYLSAEDYWGARHVREPMSWRRGESARIRAFRRNVLPLRSEFVRVGLEVELDADGGLTVRDEDRSWACPLIGAVHWLTADADAATDAEFAVAFMRDCERIVSCGVDVLAHPFRLFRRSKRSVPKDLYAPLADALAATGTAAEVNFHGNSPDPEFFAACIERGVKIAFGSDAHAMYEVAGLGGHLAFLRGIAGSDDVSELLWYP